MLVELVLVFLSLPFLAGRELAAQDRHDNLQQLADKYYKLAALKMSDDGRWLVAYKSYDLNNDTVMIFSSNDTENPLGYRTNVRDIAFLCNDNLLMYGNQKAELVNLKTQTSQSFKRVRQIQALKGNNIFVMQYNDEEQNRLEFRDSKGGLLNTINNVSRYYVCGNDSVYVITEGEDDKFRIALLKGKSTEMIYSTSQRISKMELSRGGKGIMICEQSQDSISQDVLFLDLTSGSVYPLKEVLSASIQNVFSEEIRSGDGYFLKLQLKSRKSDNSLVDIWYGKDNKLEKKTHPPIMEVYYLWKPKKKWIRQIGNSNLIYSISLGNDRQFLCYDPYCFQDYTNYKPKLKLYVYDVLQNRYSVMDTITGEFYLSGNGDYSLSSGNKGWVLNHIPSGNKRFIPVKCSGKPWFTNDSKSILFEGYDALLKYEIESGLLSELADFKGYQISVENGKCEFLKVLSYNFSKQTVNPSEPLIIKLSDPQNELTSYILWQNGKAKTIIPSSSAKIQFFNFSKNYDWFSWVEENYNQPPYLVLKETGKKEHVLFKSNETDKAVLSLKQDIITYTNSGGVPLKGILYYPLNYNSTLKYPMVVHIYQVQSRKAANEYPVVSCCKGNNDGYNLRLLLENGYFVYYPDIVYDEKGTGLSALDCVNHSLDALENNRSIDKSKIGLIGHSHGGYETNFIATHSKRFATYVSGAGNSDIVRSYFSFNNNFHSPFYWQFESGQYEMKKSFREDKELYFKNNPIYYVDQVNAPVLLWAGMKDQNIYWEQTMEFYIGLKRNNKTVITLFYPGEGHALFNPQACMDLVSRVMDWFDYFLKGDVKAGWIDKEIKEDAY